MDDAVMIREVAEKIAAAIQRRDVHALRSTLAPGFVHRTHGGQAVDAEGFLSGVERIPGEITFVRLEQLTIDLCGGSALATGVQHAQVSVDGQMIDDRRGFVDWFISHEGKWRIQAAVDLPAPG